MFLLTALLAAALGLMAAGHVVARRRPRFGKVLVPALAALLVGKAVLDSRPDWEWRLFPWRDYAFVQGFVVYTLAAAFFGAASAALPTKWNRVVVLLVGLGVLGHGAVRHRWLAWPEVHGDARVADRNLHVQQSTMYTCGPAACCTALAHLGIVVDERTMAAACLTRSDGTRLFDLYRGLVVTTAGHAIAVSIEDPSADEILAERLVVVGTNEGRGHALCYVGRGDYVVRHDPLRRHADEWDPANLRTHYRGPAVVLRPLGPAAAPR
ncbi:MAG: hypothetical protein JNK15_07610 [Planctomycetes bacterium]|nr:hypothetical protein [Planctomycetota bacterium]